MGREEPGAATAGTYRRGEDPFASCAFQEVDDAAAVARLVQRPVESIVVPPGGWWVVLCGGGALGAEVVYVWPQGEALPPAVRDRLVEAAIDAVEVPFLAPRSSPAGTQDQPLITGLDTWLWVEPAAWAPVSASAAIPVATVTATATPSEVSWTAGDGSPPARCAGPGQPWRAGLAADVVPECGHRYERTSGEQPDGTWPLSVTVTWEVTWTCAPACGGGDGPPFILTVTRPVTVEQVQTRLSR